MSTQTRPCDDCKTHKATIPFANSTMDFVHGFALNICRCCYLKRVETAYNETRENYEKLKADTTICE